MDVHALELDLEAELLCHDLQDLSVKTLVDADEHAEAHAGGDDLGHRDVHQSGQLVGGDELRNLEDFLFLHFVHSLLLKLVLDVVTFLATVLRSLRLAHRLQSGECLLYLFLDFFIRKLWLLLEDRLFAFLEAVFRTFLVLAWLAALTLLLATLLWLAALVFRLVGTSYLIRIDWSIADAFAFLLLVAGRWCLRLAFAFVLDR